MKLLCFDSACRKKEPRTQNSMELYHMGPWNFKSTKILHSLDNKSKNQSDNTIIKQT